MKKMFFINDTVENKISYYHLAFMLATLPFDFFYTRLFFISFGVHTLIHARKIKIGDIFTKSVLVLVSLYLLGVIGVLYSHDKDEAFSIVLRQWSILIVPIVFSISNFDIDKCKPNLFCIFGFACTVAILYLYADALLTINYFHLPLSSLFSITFMNHSFSMPFKIHATYLSIYTAISIIYFLYVLFSSKPGKEKWFYIFCTMVLTAGLIQLSSRSVFIAILIIINLFFPFFLFKGKKRLAFFLTACFISVCVLLLIDNVDSFKTRYISELKSDLTANVKMIENTEPRLARWEGIVELIKKSPVIGYGTGAERKELKEKYFEKRLYISYLNEFNAHSQYLSILIRLGIIGLLCYMYILYVGFAAAFRKQDILFLAFMVIITTVSVSENFMDMDRGVFFYSFFFSIFLVGGSKTVRETNNEMR